MFSVRLFVLWAILASPLVVDYRFDEVAGNSRLLSSLSFLFAYSLSVVLIVDGIKLTPVRFSVSTLLLTPVFLAELLRSISYYLQGEGFNERFLFHFNANTLLEAGTAYPLALLLFAMCLAAMQVVLYWNLLCARNAHGFLYFLFPAIAIYLASESAVAEFYSSYVTLFQRGASQHSYDNRSSSLRIYREMGLNPEVIGQQVTSAKPGKNLVLIYLESVEAIYTDEAIFKGLTPELNEYKAQGLNFDNVRQTLGTGWTIAGMLASQCGTPLLLSSIAGVNDAMEYGFFDKAICLGDILRQAGYVQSFMGGATTRFAGKGNFLRRHGYDRVKGLEELEGLVAEADYRSSWGLFDDSLFDLAIDEYRRLAKAERPFNLTLLTLDTHHPSGQASKSCKPYPHLRNSMLDAVYCTDQLLHRFLDALSSEPQFEDTLVVIMNDHLAMRNKAYPLYPKGYERKMMLILLNSGESGVDHALGTHMDVAPTILQALGVEYNVGFLLGNSLLSRDSDLRRPSYGDKRLLQIVREINTNYLSRSSTNICESGNLIEVTENRQFRIGDQYVPMNLDGQTVSPDRFGGELAFLALIESDGTVESSSIVETRNIPGLVYNKLDRYLLIVTSARALPWGMDEHLQRRGSPYVVAFGRAPHDIRLLGESPVLGQLHVDNGVCESLKTEGNEEARRRREEISSYYRQRCAKESKSRLPEYRSDTGLLQIPDLSGTYHVLLEKNRGRFEVVDYDFLEGRSPSETNECIPNLTAGELYLPVILIDGMPHYAVDMQRVSTLAVEIGNDNKKLFR